MSWMLGSLVQLIWALIDPSILGPYSIPQGSLAWIGKFIWCGIGIAIFIWNLWEIFKPGIEKQSFIPLTRVPVGDISVGIPNPTFKTTYVFVSSHPSYVIVDSIILFFYWFLSWLGEIPLSLHVGLGRNLAIGFWIGASIPILRIVAWYGLRIRPTTWDSTTQKLVKEAWKPATLFAVFFIL